MYWWPALTRTGRLVAWSIDSIDMCHDDVVLNDIIIWQRGVLSSALPSHLGGEPVGGQWVAAAEPDLTSRHDEGLVCVCTAQLMGIRLNFWHVNVAATASYKESVYMRVLPLHCPAPTRRPYPILMGSAFNKVRHVHVAGVSQHQGMSRC